MKIVGDPSVEATLGKSATDSEIPLYKPPSEEEALFTEEIDVEEEIRKQAASPKDVPRQSGSTGRKPDASRPSEVGFPLFTKEEGAGFDFSLEAGDEQVDVGRDAPSAPRSGKKPTSPPPGSDSDVRLISDQDLSLGSDSDIKLAAPQSSATRRKGAPAATPPYQPKSAISPGPKSPSKGIKSAGPLSPKMGPSSPRKPAASDSDVKIVGAGPRDPDGGQSDSDIRLEGRGGSAGGPEALLLTEEINLDEEIRVQEETLKSQRSGRVRPLSKLGKSSGSMPASPYGLPDVGMAPPPPSHDSSDFDLTPGSSDESEDFSLELPDDDGIAVGEQFGHELKGPTSGINLADPVDAGISLEFEERPGHSGKTPRPSEPAASDSGSDFELNLDDSSDERPAAQASAYDSSSEIPAADADASASSEFELSLEDSSEELRSQGQSQESSDFELASPSDSSSEENPSISPQDSGSEFELSLDDSSGEVAPQVESKDSSEFEITLDSSSGELEVEPSAESGSDSEFDLSLDDSGSISASGEQDAIDQEGTDRDIFETDFDVPGLDEESRLAGSGSGRAGGARKL